MTTRPPNVLLITTEDNGPELGCYGDQNASTPNIDRLSRNGVRFDTGYATQAMCSPGRASILTGLYPHQNGQTGLQTHKYRMFDGIDTLPTLLHEAGYRTGRLGKLHVDPEDSFVFDMEKDPWGFDSRDVRTRAENARDFMTANNEPFFLMVNYRDAHLPWIDQYDGLPEEPAGADDVSVPPSVGVDTGRLREHAAGYYNCLQRVDRGIGMLLDVLDEIGQVEETIVIYTTDHGPQFSRGKMTCYELGIRVPLIIRWSDVAKSGTVRTELVSQIDIMPTILDAVDAHIPPEVSGRSLRPLITDECDTDWRNHVFAEWNSSGPYNCYPQRVVRGERYKLIMNMRSGVESPIERYYSVERRIDTGTTEEEIANASQVVREAYECWRNPPAFELYDLRTDPNEFYNLAQDPEYADVRDRLVQRLEAWQRETGDKLAEPELFKRYVNEHARAEARETRPRYDPDFTWDYLNYLSND